MLERQGHLPGYTGHIPKHSQIDEPYLPQPKFHHIPNYQGFIPSVKAENLHGRTYANITESVALNRFIKGKDLPAEERYKSVAHENYTFKLRTAVNPFGPKIYPEPPVEPLSVIPESTVSSFFGINIPGSKIFLQPQQKKVVKEGKKDEKNELLNYEEARKLADQEKKGK